MHTVQAGPLRHVVVEVLKDVLHPEGGCTLQPEVPPAGSR